MENKIKELKRIYSKNKKKIKRRLKEFKSNLKKEENIICEFFFCLLTPQSKAKECWQSIEQLKKKNLLFCGSEYRIKNCLKNVRFKNKKAKYLVEASKLFKEDNSFLKFIIENKKNPFYLREFLVWNVKGFGYKEASHFLRNIGIGENLAILDRHILKNLKEFNIIDEIPATLTKKKYIEIEKKFIEFSKKIGIKPAELDLLLWAKEKGEVFK
ncbi:MAG: N-glycosylase/DNA lyase [Candidatus Omnitrophica bacterium]|nr:N-glycosylase/DNA lyase [Candidatus Omnitrophota bacterium]